MKGTKLKKVFSLILVLALVLTMMPTAAFAAGDESTVVYNASSQGKYPNTITGYLNTITLTGAAVEKYEVSGKTTINVHLASTTADDAAVKLTATSGGSMVGSLSPASANVTLEGGKATQTFTLSPKVNNMFTKTTFTVNIDIASAEEHTCNYSKYEKVNDEYHKKICSCGKFETEGHTLSAWAKVDENTHAKTCVCSFSVTEGHNIGDWTAVDRTSHNKTCSVCNNEVVKEGHNYGKAASTDDEKHAFTCSDCGKIKYDPHTWDDGRVDAEPSEGTAGSTVYTCTVCGKTKTEITHEEETEIVLTVPSGIVKPQNSTFANSFKVSGAALESENSYEFVDDSEASKPADGIVAVYSDKSAFKFEPQVNVTLSEGTQDGTVIKVRTNQMSSSDLTAPADYTKAASYVSAKIENGKATVVFPMTYLGSYEYQVDWVFNFTVKQAHVCSYSDWTIFDTETHTRSCTDVNCDKDESVKTQTASHTIKYSKLNEKLHTISCADDCGYSSTVPHTWGEGVITTPPTTDKMGVKTYTCTADGCGAFYTEDVAEVISSTIKIKVDEIKIPDSYGYIREFAFEGANVYGIAEVDKENSNLSGTLTSSDETATVIKTVYEKTVTADVTLAAGTEDGTEIKVRLPQAGFHTVITSSGALSVPANWNTYKSAVIEDGKATITYPVTYTRNAGITGEGKHVTVTYNVDWVLNFTVDEDAVIDNAPESINVKLVKVNDSKDKVYSIPYEDADDYADWVVLDENLYIGKDGDVFTFEAYDQKGNPTPVTWMANEEIEDGNAIDQDGKYKREYLTFGGTSFNYIYAVSNLDPTVTQEKIFFMTGYKLSPAYTNPVVELDSVGNPVIDHINAGVKGNTTWSVTYPEINAAKIDVKEPSLSGIQFNYQALRPGTVNVTYKLNFDDSMTETTTVTVKGVAVEDKDGNQQKTIVEISNDAPTVTTQLTAYTAEGLSVTDWSSQDESIATVDANGLVTAKSVGSVIINATDSEGNVGGIKVVVDHADIPYFQQIDFAVGADGLNPNKWSADSFKAADFEYDVQTYSDQAVTLVMNANTRYNPKWTATASYTDINGTPKNISVKNGEATYLTSIPKGEFTLTVTLSDPKDTENKNVYTFHVNRKAPKTIDIRLVAVNDSETIYSLPYEDADDYEDWVVLDDKLYIGKGGDKLTFKAYDQNGKETPVIWTANEDISAPDASIDESGVYTVDYLTFAVNSFHYIKATSELDSEVSVEKMFVMTGYGLHPYYKNLEVKLSEDGQTPAKANVNAGVKGHTTWTESFPETNAAKIEEIEVVQNGIEYDFVALRPGTFNVTYKVDFDESMTETANVTVKGVAVEDKEGKQQKTYVEISNDAPTAATQLTAYTAEGLRVVEWYSNDTRVATVDQNGLVTAKGVGSVIINAVDSEGNVGGIKVAVTHADIPYFENIGFATGIEGLNPHLWTADTFKAVKQEYNVYPYTDSLASLPMDTLYDAAKYTAKAVVTYTDNSTSAEKTIESGKVTYLPFSISGAKAAKITVTLTDKTNADNKTIYTFNVIDEGTYEGKKLAEDGITLIPYDHALSSTEKYKGQPEGTMFAADQNGIATEVTGVTPDGMYYCTYIKKGTDMFFLNLKGEGSQTIIRYSVEGDTSTWDGWHRLAQDGQTKLIRFPENADTVKITVQTISDRDYMDNVNNSIDAFQNANEYTLWVKQASADKTGGSGGGITGGGIGGGTVPSVPGTEAPEQAEPQAPATEDELSADEVKALLADLTPVVRSVKTEKKNVKVTLKIDDADKAIIEELEAAGYTVKYNFYRSTKKASKYKSMLIKDSKTYTNTKGKKGEMYYYKARVQVYDAEGKLIARTALKDCWYACRQWTK